VLTDEPPVLIHESVIDMGDGTEDGDMG
jgi:hypothetical protein